METNKTPENCWEFMSCSDSIRLNCPAYKKKDGKRCYLYCHVIPYKVSIYEDIEMGFNFGTNVSGGFFNGNPSADG